MCMRTDQSGNKGEDVLLYNPAVLWPGSALSPSKAKTTFLGLSELARGRPERSSTERTGTERSYLTREESGPRAA